MTDRAAFRFGARAAVALLVFASLLVSCGGGDDDGSVASTDTSQSDDAATDTSSEPSSNGDGDEEAAEPAPEASSGEQRLVVTIGDETYEADLSADLTVCISMGGAIGAAGPIPGIDGGSVNVDIPPEDYETSPDGWDPPSVAVDLGEDENGRPVNLRAGGEVVGAFPELAGKSQVDSYSVNGTSASGTATFIDLFQVQLAGSGQVEEPQPMQGTFEVSCG